MFGQSSDRLADFFRRAGKRRAQLLGRHQLPHRVMLAQRAARLMSREMP